MDQKALMEKLKELLKNGKLEEAKQFVNEHKEGLGDYLEQAKEIVKNGDINGVMNKFKKFFK